MKLPFRVVELVSCPHQDSISTPTTGTSLWTINHHHKACPVRILTIELFALQCAYSGTTLQRLPIREYDIRFESLVYQAIGPFFLVDATSPVRNEEGATCCKFVRGEYWCRWGCLMCRWCLAC